MDLQASFRSKVCQILFEHPSVITIAAAAVCCNQNTVCIRINILAGGIPPPANTLNSKLRCVTASTKIYKSMICPNVINSIGNRFHLRKIMAIYTQGRTGNPPNRTWILEITYDFLF